MNFAFSNPGDFRYGTEYSNRTCEIHLKHLPCIKRKNNEKHVLRIQLCDPNISNINQISIAHNGLKKKHAIIYSTFER